MQKPFTSAASSPGPDTCGCWLLGVCFRLVCCLFPCWFLFAFGLGWISFPSGCVSFHTEAVTSVTLSLVKVGTRFIRGDYPSLFTIVVMDCQYPREQPQPNLKKKLVGHLDPSLLDENQVPHGALNPNEKQKQTQKHTIKPTKPTTNHKTKQQTKKGQKHQSRGRVKRVKHPSFIT